MEKEKAIEILKNVAWNAGSVDRDEIQAAVAAAIIALNEIAPKRLNSCHEDDSVDCDECPAHRSTSWCALAIPQYEGIDDLYKARMEGFWDGFHYAEDEYKILMEILEEYDKEKLDGKE